MEKIQALCKRITPKYYPLVSFLLAALTVTMAMSYAGILSNGKNTVLNGDLFAAVVPLQKMAMNQLASGQRWTYSWNTMMGQNTTLLYPLYVMSPFSLLFLVIPDTVLAAELAMILKIATAALCFCLFLQKGMKEDGGKTIFFSVCYSLCAYQFQFFRIYSTLDILYLLPLVMLSLLYFIRTKKAFPLILTYTASFVIYFYSGYLIGIFSGITFLVILIYQKYYQQPKKMGGLIAKYVASVVAAILMSLIILLPAIYFVMMNPSGGDATFLKPRLLVTDIPFAMFLGKGISLYNDVPYLYCGLPVLILLPFYFVNKQIAKKERIVAGGVLLFFTLSIFITPIYQLLHCFNRPDGYTVRYVPLWVFCMIVIACRQSKYLSEMKTKRSICWIGLLLVLYMATYLLNQRVYEEKTIYISGVLIIINALFLLIWGGIVFTWKKQKDLFSILFFAMFCIMLELGTNAFLMLKDVIYVSESSIQNADEQIETVVSQIKEQDANPQRISCTNSFMINQGVQYNYMAVSGFSSARKKELLHLLCKLGENVTDFAIINNGATDVTDMLFGVKYQMYIDDPNIVGDVQLQYGYYAKDYVLSFGYMVSDDIYAIPVLNRNAFHNQNMILTAMLGETCNVYIPTAEISINQNNALLGTNEDFYYVVNENYGQIGSIDFEIPKEEYKEAYALFMQNAEEETEITESFTDGSLINRLFVVSYGDERVCLDSRRDLIREAAVVEMEETEQSFKVSLYNMDQEQKPIGYCDALFYYQDDDELNRVYETLAENQWSLNTFTNTYLKASVEVPENRTVLFTSIPYDEGWQCIVDGETACTVPLLENAFLGIQLTPGTHEVELKYIAPGEKEGDCCAILGIIITLVIIYLDRRKKGRTKK